MNAPAEYINDVLHFSSQKIDLNKYSYSGPTYFYDLNFIRQRYELMKATLGQTKIFYAMKANSNPEVLKTLKECGAGADVVSAGEIARALEVGFTPDQIVFSGVGKTRKELLYALELGIFQINVESIPELEHIGRLARELGKKAKIAIRLNPNVDIKTHPYIATGLHENKFGIEVSALGLVRSLLSSYAENLELVGISLHLGSQMTDFSGLQMALKQLKVTYLELKNEFPTVRRFDFGGGLGIIYETLDLAVESEMLANYGKIILSEIGSLGCELQTEPGRWLVAHAGILLAQVQYVKKTPFKSFIILDTGMNHLVRPMLYGSYHSIVPVLANKKREVATYDVVGPICESSDFLAKDRSMKEIQASELIAILDVGAYGFSMANTYNLQPLPQEHCY
jgi:diaminopimelate decarboxylase